MTKEFHHVTVLLHETIDMLDVKPDGVYVDATFWVEQAIANIYWQIK